MAVQGLIMQESAARIVLESCVNCGHKAFLDPTPPDIRYDNSLEPLITKKVPAGIDKIDLSIFARSQWCVCGHCGVILSRARPNLDQAVQWYEPVFEYSEKRKYNTSPLPQIYIENHDAFAAELFESMTAAGACEDVESILHLRCQAGSLLQLFRQRLGIEETYGMEYFEHAVDYAAGKLGKDRVAIMAGPEPKIPFPPAKYDLLVLDHILTHVQQPRDYLMYLMTLLAEGGKIVLKDKDHGRALNSAFQYDRGLNFFHMQLYTLENLTAFLRSCGLTVERLADPTPRRWAVGADSVLLLCTKGDMAEIERGDVEGNMALMTKWWTKHRRMRKARGWPKFARRVWGCHLNALM